MKDNSRQPEQAVSYGVFPAADEDTSLKRGKTKILASTSILCIGELFGGLTVHWQMPLAHVPCPLQSLRQGASLVSITLLVSLPLKPDGLDSTITILPLLSCTTAQSIEDECVQGTSRPLCKLT